MDGKVSFNTVFVFVISIYRSIEVNKMIANIRIFRASLCDKNDRRQCLRVVKVDFELKVPK